MPYQGPDGYIPPSSSSYGSRNLHPGQAQAYLGNGQYSQYSHMTSSQPAYHNRQNWPHANNSHTAYSAPSFYDPSQSSLYQTSGQPDARQAYLSPPLQTLQTTPFPQGPYHSADPRYTQRPPIEAQQHQQQAYMNSSRATQPLVPEQRQQWTKFPTLPYTTSAHTNTNAAQSNTWLPQQQQQQQHLPPPKQQTSPPQVAASQFANKPRERKQEPLSETSRASVNVPGSLGTSNRRNSQQTAGPNQPSTSGWQSIPRERLQDQHPQQHHRQQSWTQSGPQPPFQQAEHSRPTLPGPQQARDPPYPHGSVGRPMSTDQQQQHSHMPLQTPSKGKHSPSSPGKKPKQEPAPSLVPGHGLTRPPPTINPNLLKQRVVHVENPVQRVSSIKIEDDVSMAPPTKRRRSNEGQAIPVCKPVLVPTKSSSLPRTKQPSSSPLTELASSQLPRNPDSNPSIDYQTALLALSDEYITTAYNMSSDLAGAEVSDQQLDHYQALLATGMGCLDSVLHNYRIQDARKEARIRLRYAGLLFEETSNDMEAEEVLTKGILVCERARLIDLKYAMHHLLARLWFKGNQAKAALKAIDKHVAELEKLEMVHWVYAFRFLRVSLGLQLGHSQSDTAALTKHLTAIHETASQHGHVAVQIVASTLEALIHLRSRAPDCVDSAYGAMAAARTHQLAPEMASLPQIQELLDCIDLSCSLTRTESQQAIAKMDAMHQNMDSFTRDPSWNKDGNWHIALPGVEVSSSDLAADTGGIMRSLPNSSCALNFKWLTSTEVYNLGYLLSGLASIFMNASHDRKAEAFLEEGLKLSMRPFTAMPRSLTAASADCQHSRVLRIVIQVYDVFATCGRADWETGLQGLKDIRQDLDDLEGPPGADLNDLIIYLNAICLHGLGDLDGALKLYQSEDLRVDLEHETAAATGTMKPIKLLAALNSILALRHFGNHREADTLLHYAQKFCRTKVNNNGSEYGSKLLESAWFILKATEPPEKLGENSIVKTKQCLASAVEAAKKAHNNRLLCVVINFMTDMFFHNIVGGQAEASARAGWTLARKIQDKLWCGVASSMYGDTLERSGKIKDAAVARKDAMDSVKHLPESLKEALTADDAMSKV